MERDNAILFFRRVMDRGKQVVQALPPDTGLFPDEQTYLEPVNPNLPAMPAVKPSDTDLLCEIAENTRALKRRDTSKRTLRVMATTVVAGTVTTVSGNRNRTSISLYNEGPQTVYIVQYYDDSTARGMPIPVNAEREIEATTDIHLLSDGTSDVRTIEEFSQ